MAVTTLTAIRQKVRRLTRSPSTTQLTDADINENVNTFLLYDLPEHLRLFTNRTTFVFYTIPFLDEYSGETLNPSPVIGGDPNWLGENFKDKYISFHRPAYIGGFESDIWQGREEFFRIFPKINSVRKVGEGDGVSSTITGTISEAPFLVNHVTFETRTNPNPLAGNTSTQLTAFDVPNNPFNQRGKFQLVGAPAPDPNTFINYETGEFSVDFDLPIGSNEDVFAHTVSYEEARPELILYFDNKFFLRPVPDKSYRVELEAQVRPTELLSSGQSPELEQWWQYIAYGAAKKIFEDRTDTESIAQILPEFKQQELLVLRRTIDIQTKERVSTIYSEQTSKDAGPFAWWNGGNFS